MGKDGSFAVRTAVFDPQVTFPDEESLILHLSDPRNRVPGKPFDEPLNTMNWSTVSGMIDREEYMPKMLDRVQRTDVNGLKKQLSDVNFKPSKKATTPEQIAKEQEKFNKYNNLQNTLSEANANWLADPAANETKPGHPVPDRLRDYRIALGKHIQTVMAQHQVTPEMVIKAINDKKIRNGPRVSNPRSNQAWLQAILSGNPQPYSRSDFSTLAEGINLASPAKPQLNDADLFADYKYEYDKYSHEDYIHLTASETTAPSVFGRYLLHRQRVMMSKDFATNMWSSKLIACFLQMSRLHKNYSSYDGEKGGGPRPDAAGVGRHMWEATNFEHALHPELPNEDGTTTNITNQDEASELGRRMRGLPEKDLYDSFNPTSPRDVQVRPDGQGGFNSTNVQADPAEMYEAIIKNYRKENQNIGVSQALKNMKQESINDLATAIQNRQKNAEDLQSAISGGPEKTMAKCRSELVKNDYEISHLVTKLRQQTDKNDPVAKANANKQANDFITNRLNQLATQQNKTPEAFAAEYLQTQQKHNQTSIEIAKKRLEKVQGVNVEQFGDKDPLLNPGKLKDVAPEEATKMKKLYQDLIDTIVPLKYKTRVPGTQNKPIDYVKNYRPIEPAQATIDLVVKTAEIMDRLGSIKERIHKTSIPVELVDNLMNRIGEQYDKQILLIARRKYVGREFDSTTSQDRRRLWSLL
jgi:hypothetical protein